jgi:ABC-type molybdate transport system substrate-binding protein
LTVLLAAAPSVAEQRRIFAAGSLRLALNEIVDKYAQVNGTRFEVLYGPSGKLREKIEQGDVPALFASAAVEHVQVSVRASAPSLMRRATREYRH